MKISAGAIRAPPFFVSNLDRPENENRKIKWEDTLQEKNVINTELEPTKKHETTLSWPNLCASAPIGDKSGSVLEVRCLSLLGCPYVVSDGRIATQLPLITTGERLLEEDRTRGNCARTI